MDGVIMELKPGEVICDECLGTGESIAHHSCPKCWGNGKLDWIENVVGKRPKVSNEFFKAKWSDEILDSWPQANEYIDELAKQLAQDIDKKILESLNGMWTYDES
jgi:hypothetical protein